jgi:hypothetical protein
MKQAEAHFQGVRHPPDALFTTLALTIEPASTAGLLRFRYHIAGTNCKISL